MLIVIGELFNSFICEPEMNENSCLSTAVYWEIILKEI